MISSSRSTADSYVVASALIWYLLVRLDRARPDAPVRQSRVEISRLPHRGGARERLPGVVDQQRVAPLQRALGVEAAERGGVRVERLGAAILEREPRPV